ncbi:prepilin-type N-terminal cleavage/methylation domain-containing protein [Vibrio sp. SS-MA-C1-2]|uniref:pilus assembly FimT family protein n=1 Tax=Vibrio sp. SS-MA-C1-2 TaxID=2908646 RepID=UPI001F38E973|nr:prepilin-type N-terminal cleavage/methylation domain-containing protein [Vibrio sp. SS-MA-C1-2]UJF18996.1 prepilin-type N-terminal cleavage/methylation domain-containing protein [Vibrio sp. SS-MA-C1-2]
MLNRDAINQKGFTLLELIVVTTILSMMMLLSWSQINTVLQQQKLYLLAIQLKAFIQHQRRQAILLKQPRYILFLQSSESSCLLSSPKPDLLINNCQSNDRVKQRDILDLVVTSSLSLSRYTENDKRPLTPGLLFYFYRHAGDSSQNYRLVFQLNNQPNINAGIRITHNGKVRLCSSMKNYSMEIC